MNRKVSVVLEDEDVVLKLHPYKPGQRIERMYLNPMEAMKMYLALGDYIMEREGNDEAARG